jgi:hypothetical protein
MKTEKEIRERLAQAESRLRDTMASIRDPWQSHSRTSFLEQTAMYEDEMELLSWVLGARE